MTIYKKADEYMGEVSNRLSKIFRASKAGYKVPDAERHRLEGFIQAGIYLEIVTNSEMKETMEQVHFSVFGKTIKQRHKEKPVAWPEVVFEYDRYDQPTRVRERGMRRFKSIAQAQRFLGVHATVYNLFNLGRHLISASHYRLIRMRAFASWKSAVA